MALNGPSIDDALLDGLVEHLRDFLDGKLPTNDVNEILQVVRTWAANPEPETSTALDRLTPSLRRRVAEATLTKRADDAAAFAKRFPGAGRIRTL